MIGTLLAKRYSVESTLGQGGMGVVYLAHDTLLDRPVAIKAVSAAMLGDEGSRRLLREAQSAAGLTHPNIVAIYDVLEEADQRLIVMEYVAGRTLHELSPLGWPEAVDVGFQVAAALAYAHGEGVIHRDIKPENILVTPERVAKVMDFGLARSEGRSRLTQTGMVVGTVTYMSPEQTLQGLATPRSDLYSLGCVLYEVITGRPPFEAEDPIAVITQHINIPPVAPRFYAPEIPPALESIILKLLAKDPNDRFTSAGQLMQVLDTVRAAAQTPAAAEAKAAGAELVQAVHRGVLVGREAEVQTLKGIVDGAAAGGGRLVLVAGPAGVGKTRLAEEAITYAHRMAEEVGEPNWVAFHQAMVAGCSFSLGDWADARRRFEVVIALGPRGGLLARHSPVHLHLLAEDWEATIDALERQLAEREASRDKQWVTVFLQELAEASLQNGAYQAAEAYARRAVEENPEWFDSWSGILLTKALIRLGRREEAVAVCDRTEKDARARKGTGLMADVHHLRGLVAAAAGDRSGAEQHLRTTIDILDRYPRPYLQAQVLEDLAAVQTDPRAARETSERALAIYERIGAQRSAARVRAASEARGA